MANLKIICLLFIFEGFGVSLPAQEIERFNTFTYNVNEGLLQSHVDDLAFDKNNFGWLSFANGIQKFDGEHFTDVPIQPGLPDDRNVQFFTDKERNLWISHSHGVSRYESSGNSFIEVYKNRLGPAIPSLIFGEDDGIIYFFTSEGNIIGIHGQSGELVSHVQTGFKNYITAFQNGLKNTNIINHRIGFLVDSCLVLWDLKENKLLYTTKKIHDIIFYFLHLKNESEIMYYTQSPEKNLHIYNYNFIQNRPTLIAITANDKQKPFRSCAFRWNDRKLLTIFNHLYTTDSLYSQYTSEIVNLQNEPVSGNAVINDIKEDNYGNLYLLTVNEGIRKINRNNYKIKYYGTSKKENNFIISLCIDKQENRILAGAYGGGLLVFDTLQHLVKHINKFQGVNSGFSPSGIIKIHKDDYLLLCWGEQKIWRVTNNFSTFTPFSFANKEKAEDNMINYYGNFIFQNERNALFQTNNSFYKIDPSKPAVYKYYLGNDISYGAILYKNTIASMAKNALIFIDTATFGITRKAPFKYISFARCIEKDRNNNIYIGSDNGLYKVDENGKLLMHLDKASGMPDECIYAIVCDNEGQIWCSTNKGIIKLQNDGSKLLLTKQDGLQENEFNNNIAALADDGEIFFGGVNGVNSFYPSAIGTTEDKINLLVTGIKINNREVKRDSAAWNIKELDLPYNQSSLAFDFIAMASNNPGQYIYQYKMKGVDNEWIQNNGLQTVRYYLSPGTYTFQVFASRFFDKNAQAMKEIYIKIHPPFWKAWWFLSGLLFLLIAILAYGINRYNRTQYKRQLSVFEGENKMRMERERISRDLHDNIGSYANAVLYNTELLGEENNEASRTELIRDLRFASKDIITSLRETVWALKQDNYSAEDCLVRIRNFIQLFTRYYHDIQFKVEGDVPKEKILQYDKALHLVRIVQEAVSNAIRHADAKNISIFSSPDNGNWKLVVTDDGIGFDYKEKKELLQGNGLDNMSQRAADAGLLFTINSVKGEGSVITIIG